MPTAEAIPRGWPGPFHAGARTMATRSGVGMARAVGRFPIPESQPGCGQA